jgi:hypothetical protein
MTERRTTTLGTHEGEELVNQLATASEQMRAALHTLHSMDTGELYPAEWSTQLYRLIEIGQRLEQLCEMVGRRFRGMEHAYPYEVGTDNGAAIVATLATAMLGLAKAKRGLPGVLEPLNQAYQRTETLTLAVPDGADE